MARITADRVVETSTTTGTGSITLAGALSGFQAFSAVTSDGDTFDYTIFAVDANGVPTGAWETGFGTRTSSTVMARTTVQASSNAGAAVSFAAGTKHVMLSLNAKTVRFVGCKVYNNAAQSIPNTTETAVTFDSEDFDTVGLHSTSSNTSRLTIPAGYSGIWQIFFNVAFASGAGNNRSSYLRKNGTDLIISSTTLRIPSASIPMNLSNDVITSLTAGDYVELMVFQDSGGAKNLGASVAGDAGLVSGVTARWLGNV